ncbi:hypothetical protein [Symbiopectobacterium purcellii]|uniref:Uncharacterized protein n=1 Tax=Symbiopectobacterium purcellii TaxID=2871826 RepID=A0ABX9AII5_9ENTR|nr:hypothetical protein [Symbiopectobacterium purcellii]QZN94987.1 hypothetical protein K6K13_17385 [Symbiopectobacterium purcellii]
MIIKIYSPPTMHIALSAQNTKDTAHKKNLSRCISFTENSSNDIKTKAKEISLKYDLLVDDILCDTPGVLKNQRERLRTLGLAVTALEQRTKTDSSNAEKKPMLDVAITEKIKYICDALPVNRKRNFTHDNAYLLRGNNFISEFLSSKETSVDKISYAQLLSIGEDMRKNCADPASVDQVAIKKFSTVWDLRTALAQ